MAAKRHSTAWNDLPEQNIWITVAEVGVVVLALICMALFAPLGTVQFQRSALVFGGALLVYAVLKICLVKNAAARWGLPFSGKSRPVWNMSSSGDETTGFVTVGGLFLAGLVPIFLLKLFFPLELQVSAAIYFTWCIIQDLIFFAIVLTSLESLTNSSIAIVGAAVLFGASHYPFWPLAVATMLIGTVWGYTFVQTRSFVWVLVSHFIMGLCLLG